MPGLIESHAHLSIDDVDDLGKIGMIPPEENTLLAMRVARDYLDYGITSCISAAAAKPRIDVVISGDTFVPHAPSHSTVMSEAEVAAAAEVVHAHGKRMSAHARSAESVKLCVRHGVKIIYHANFADEEALDLLEEHRDQLFVSPNIGFTVVAAYESSEWFTEQQVVEFGFREELAGAIKGVRELRKRGWRLRRWGRHYRS